MRPGLLRMHAALLADGSGWCRGWVSLMVRRVLCFVVAGEFLCITRAYYFLPLEPAAVSPFFRHPTQVRVHKEPCNGIHGKFATFSPLWRLQRFI